MSSYGVWVWVCVRVCVHTMHEHICVLCIDMILHVCVWVCFCVCVHLATGSNVKYQFSSFFAYQVV